MGFDLKKWCQIAELDHKSEWKHQNFQVESPKITKQGIGKPKMAC